MFDRFIFVDEFYTNYNQKSLKRKKKRRTNKSISLSRVVTSNHILPRAKQSNNSIIIQHTYINQYKKGLVGFAAKLFYKFKQSLPMSDGVHKANNEIFKVNEARCLYLWNDECLKISATEGLDVRGTFSVASLRILVCYIVVTKRERERRAINI